VADPYKPRAPFAPWDRRQLPGLFDVEETARRVGNYKWAEMKLFEALGGWIATVPELDVKMRLGTHCYHHAWHAELWHKRLPELREMNPDRLTVPANEAMERFVERISEASRRVDPALKLLEPAIPWANIAGIGNILRHDYNRVDRMILWNIATRDLPVLEQAVERLLAGLDSGA